MVRLPSGSCTLCCLFTDLCFVFGCNCLDQDQPARFTEKRAPPGRATFTNSPCCEGLRTAFREYLDASLVALSPTGILARDSSPTLQTVSKTPVIKVPHRRCLFHVDGNLDDLDGSSKSIRNSPSKSLNSGFGPQITSRESRDVPLLP
eukprot:s5991_g3.t1